MSFTVRDAKDPRLLAAAVNDLQVSGAGLVADGSITAAKIATNAVDSAEIKADAVITAKIANGAVETAKLAADAVTVDQLADDAVETSKIKDEAVTGAKLDAGIIEPYIVAAGNGAAARTATGTKVGDTVICAINLTDLTNNAADFEAEITVNDQIQQSGTDHTGDKILVLTIARS